MLLDVLEVEELAKHEAALRIAAGQLEKPPHDALRGGCISRVGDETSFMSGCWPKLRASSTA